MNSYFNYGGSGAEGTGGGGGMVVHCFPGLLGTPPESLLPVTWGGSCWKCLCSCLRRRGDWGGGKQLSEILDLSQHSSIIYPLPPTLIEDIATILETLKSFRSGCMKPRLPPHLEMFFCLLVPPHVLIVRFPPLSLEGEGSEEGVAKRM